MKCPHCNKDLSVNVDPIIQLKAHIINQVRANKKFIERTKAYRPDGDFSSRENTINKWQSWLEAIEKLEAKNEKG